jgi:hypothetical protein
MEARKRALRREKEDHVSEERDKMSEPEEKFAKDGDDVEAHKYLTKMGEPDEKFETDEDDVEAHILAPKNTPKHDV